MKTKMIKNAISMMLALLVFTTIGLTACSTNKQNKVIIWAWDAYANAAEKAVELYKGNHGHIFLWTLYLIRCAWLNA